MGKAVYATSIGGFLCPSRPNAATVAATTNGGANKWAIGNYAGNFFVFGDRNALSTEGKTRLAMLSRRSFTNLYVYRALWHMRQQWQAE